MWFISSVCYHGPRRQLHNNSTPTMALLEKSLKLVALFNGRCNKIVEGSEDPYNFISPRLYIQKLEKLTMATVPLVSNALRRYEQVATSPYFIYFLIMIFYFDLYYKHNGLSPYRTVIKL